MKLSCGLSCVRFVSDGKVFKKPQTEPQGFATLHRFLSRNDGDSTNEMRDGAVSFSCPDYPTFSEFQTCFRLWLQRYFSVCFNLVVGSGGWSLLHQDNKGVFFLDIHELILCGKFHPFSSIVASNKFFATTIWQRSDAHTRTYPLKSPYCLAVPPPPPPCVVFSG